MLHSKLISWYTTGHNWIVVSDQIEMLQYLVHTQSDAEVTRFVSLNRILVMIVFHLLYSHCSNEVTLRIIDK